MPSENIISQVWQVIFIQIGLLLEISRVATRSTKLRFFNQRNRIINLFK